MRSALASLSLTLFLAASAFSQPENFLIVLLDDVGIEKIKAFDVWQQHSLPMPITPHIDTLASEGVRFRNTWSNPVCSPTRSMLLTGRYGFRTGIGAIMGAVVDPEDPGSSPGGSYNLKPEEKWLPALLDPAGCTVACYSSAAIGKWHLTYVVDQDQPTTPPLESGFDQHVGAVANLGNKVFSRTVGETTQSIPSSYLTWRKISNGSFVTQTVDGVNHYLYSVYEDPFEPSAATLLYPERYAGRDIANEAIERIDGDGSGDLAEPWLLYVPFNLAHAPFHIPPSDLSPTSEVLEEDQLYDLSTTLSATPTKAEMHRAMLEAADQEIGRILAALAANPAGAQARTTVILTSDNGTPQMAVDPPYTAGFAKGTVHDGGVNVPLIIKSPRLDNYVDNQGKESTALSTVADIYATVEQIADDKINTAQQDDIPYLGGEDSKSLVPFLTDVNVGAAGSLPDDPAGHLPDVLQHATIYTEFFKTNGVPSQQDQEEAAPTGSNTYQSTWKRAIRGPQYKLIREQGIDTQLYDLAANSLELAQGTPPVGNLIGLSAYSAVQSQLSAAMNSTFGLARCGGGTDIDGDLVCDAADNCVLLANQGQVDVDGEGYGNVCDGDFDNTGYITIGDFITFQTCFPRTVGAAGGPAADPECRDSDMDHSGVITIGEFSLFRRSAVYGIPGLSCGFSSPPSCRGSLD